ncbi:long-chain-fatty-acid--CoA ligase [Desulforhopalus singaporensis]|uniref:Fatty-acyl-CoA synthase n=1 Tax=Desulforhopalus singaporensis TaxID=91360 RepID=A0A1H0UF06_9BACT|nr:long-chain-fatty-acid--CoA ligase [Desulforhopalus singaporensis]SDP64749.1 fatty-acyl-CoA synthase [Desulforhopalus singaporensis]
MSQDFITGCPATSGDDFQLNTVSFIKGAARTFPEVEVVSRRLDGSLFRYNYAEAYRRIKQLANALVNQGVQPGDRVAVVEWNTHRYWELYQAISGIGAVLLQVNLRISEDDKVYVLTHSNASHLFVNDTLLPLIEPIAKRLTTVGKYYVITDKPFEEVRSTLTLSDSYEDMLAAEKPEFDWPMVDERSAFSACYTSGTTGKPKGVYYSHRCIYLHTNAFALATEMTNRDVLLQTVPMFHCHGWGLYFSACLVGAKLVFPGMYTTETLNVLVDLMMSEKVTVNQGAPAILIPMLHYLDSLEEKPKFENLRIISGATEPSLGMMKGFAKYGANIIHAYGATESTPLVTLNALKPSLDSLTDDEKWDLKKKQGLPFVGLDLIIADATTGKPIEAGSTATGEILVKGPWITASYFDDPRSESAFVNGYWRTGDAGCLDENGYLKITDRLKDIIKSGGEWISTIDLENTIMANPKVLEACVVGVHHPKYQERPLALVALKYGMSMTAGEVIDTLGNQFAKWQLRPEEVIFVDEIPKTSVGKFSKKDIRAKYKDQYDGGRESPAEKQTAETV